MSSPPPFGFFARLWTLILNGEFLPDVWISAGIPVDLKLSFALPVSFAPPAPYQNGPVDR